MLFKDITTLNGVCQGENGCNSFVYNGLII